MATNDLSEFKSIHALLKRLNSEKKCRDYLAVIRWHGETVCPYCGWKKIYRKKDGRYACSSCLNTFSVLVGTIFQNTKLPLIKWFMGIYLLCNSKQGISSCQLAKDLGVTQKTAWFIAQKIRILFKNPEDDCKDIIQSKIVTKTSSNGNPFRVRWSYPPNFLHPKLYEFIKTASRIHEDRYICYQTLAESEKEIYQTEDPRWNYQERKGKKKIENGFWIQLKRMTFGVYHYLSASLFHRYVYEALFRHKTATFCNEDRTKLMLSRIEQVITYRVVRPL